MRDLAGLANLELTPQLGISGYLAMREPGNSERAMQEGERTVMPSWLCFAVILQHVVGNTLLPR